MKHTLPLFLSVLALAACERTGGNDWDGMDYAKIARENYRRENDATYVPPTVTGCVDDDLYNCSGRGSYR